MRYWGWLALKMCLVLGVALGLLALVAWMAAPGGVLAGWPQLERQAGWPELASHASVVVAAAISIVLGFGLGWLSASDQLYRCRRCARRLRMPISEGSYSHVLLDGARYTEYICSYGHGKLLVPEFHATTAQARQWIGFGSLWENLLDADRRGDK